MVPFMALKCHLQVYSYENKVYRQSLGVSGQLGWGILLREFVTRPLQFLTVSERKPTFAGRVSSR